MAASESVSEQKEILLTVTIQYNSKLGFLQTITYLVIYKSTLLSTAPTTICNSSTKAVFVNFNKASSFLYNIIML